jgi:tetratricopeptide (TPR) repeat protein
MKQKKSAYYVHAVLIAAVALVGVTSYMMYYDIIGRTLQSVLRLKTDPAFIGGEVAAVFYDPVGDDHGFGGLTYPVHKDFTPGSLDLVRYTVHQPVFNARWSDLPDYWQLDLAFSAPSENCRNIRIYIDADGDGKGSKVTKDELAEGVEFNSSFPWDFVLSVRNDSGILESQDGTISVPLTVMPSRSRKELTVRVPLADRNLQRLYLVPETRHYVLVGGWNPWGRDGYSEVGPQAGRGTGGGALSSLTPKLYDILVPEGTSQETLLSSWNDEDFSLPVLVPVVSAMRGASGKRPGRLSPEAAAALAQLETAAAGEEERSMNAAIALYNSSPADPGDSAAAAFFAGKNAEAEKLIDAILEKEPDSATAVAYKGALVALRGGEAPPLAAVGIIAEAYTYLDRAVSLAGTPEERITALLNRANVSKAVPDLVFGKALQGAEDFIAAAAELKKRAVESNSETASASAARIAGAYCNAAVCYETAGKKDEAETWFKEAERLLAFVGNGDGAKVRLELFRHLEGGSGVTSSKNPDDKKAGAKTKKAKPSDRLKQSKARLGEILSQIKSGQTSGPLVEEALKIRVMDTEDIKTALEFAAQHKDIVAKSKMSRIYVAMGECKMAGNVKKIEDKIEWLSRGMRNFDAIQREWPDDEKVYIYQVITYSYFPQEAGMREDVLDLLAIMEKMYLDGIWTLTADQADLVWLAIRNLTDNYPEDPERGEITEKARELANALPVLGRRPAAAELLK